MRTHDFTILLAYIVFDTVYQFLSILNLIYITLYHNFSKFVSNPPVTGLRWRLFLV